MKFIGSMSDFPFSDAVIHNGKVLETVLTGIPPGNSEPISGGVSMEMREIFRQLDAVLEEAGLSKKNLCSASIYLQNVNQDVDKINQVWQEYLGDHPLSRRCFGVELQAGMLVEAAFVAEFPE
jgi:2-iminobutanoate/2-iminopropanoate deaminase